MGSVCGGSVCGDQSHSGGGGVRRAAAAARAGGGDTMAAAAVIVSLETIFKNPAALV